jgi:hypothetical protein
MFRKILKLGALAGLFLIAASGTAAQDVIHAYAGTVSAVDAGSRTITVAASDSSRVFNDTADAKSFAALNKKLHGGMDAVSTVKEKGTFVIVYYFGTGKNRVAIGLRNLGLGPFVEEIGTVSKCDDRSIVILSDSGAVQTFNVSPDTIAETSVGATKGQRLQFEKGDHVRITALQASLTADAQFIDGSFLN